MPKYIGPTLPSMLEDKPIRIPSAVATTTTTREPTMNGMRHLNRSAYLPTTQADTPPQREGEMVSSWLCEVEKPSWSMICGKTPQSTLNSCIPRRFATELGVVVVAVVVERFSPLAKRTDGLGTSEVGAGIFGREGKFGVEMLKFSGELMGLSPCP